MLLCVDEETQKALDGIAEAVASQRTSEPIILSREYLRLIERVEQLPENRSGTDKTWVERALASWNSEIQTAREIRRA